MDLDFVNRVMKTTSFLGALIFIFGAYYFDWVYSLGLLAGALWGSANLLMIKLVVINYVTPGGRDFKKLALAIFLKFPVLYGLAFLLLKLRVFPVSAFVIGFSLVLLVVVMKALGIMMLEARPLKLGPGEGQKP